MTTVFWDVDTQFDFMTPPEHGGKLYVRDTGDPEDPGATEIRAALERLSEHAREHGILRVATGDWHSLEHREIDPDSPDYVTTFPPHCMADEVGSEKIPETWLRDPLVVPLRATPEAAREAVDRARVEGRDIFLHKEEFSCFAGNPATDELIRAIDADDIVVYGVALDVCVRHAVEGMLDRGIDVQLVEDATWGLGLEEPAALVSRWESRGLRRTTTERVLAEYPRRGREVRGTAAAREV